MLWVCARAAGTLRMQRAGRGDEQADLLLQNRQGIVGVWEGRVGAHFLVDIAYLPNAGDQVVHGLVFEYAGIGGDGVTDDGVRARAGNPAEDAGLHGEDKRSSAVAELLHHVFVRPAEQPDLERRRHPRSGGWKTSAGVNNSVQGIAIVSHGVMVDIPLIAAIVVPVVA